MKLLGTVTPGSRKVKPLNCTFDINFQEVITILSSGGSSQETIDDISYTTYVPAQVKKEAILTVDEFYPDITSRPVTFTSLDPEIGTVDSNGYVTWVSTGTAKILMSTFYLTRRYDVPLYVGPESSQTIASSYAAGSLGKNCGDNIDNLISSITTENASTYKPIYTTQNHVTSTYVRSTVCWAKDFDLTPISPWNSYSTQYRAGTLISPRHIILANHYSIPNGSTIRFITADNQVVTRTVVNSVKPVSVSDIKISVLDSDVPESIGFVKFLPDNWTDKLPGIISLGIPVLYLDQEEKALVSDLWSTGYLSDNYGEMLGFTRPRDTHRLALFELIVGGDSGNPVFVIINNELVIISAWWFGSSGSGPNYYKYKTEINSAMTTLGGGYQITEIDLSSFPSF